MPSDLLEAYILCLGFAKRAFCSSLMVNYMRIFRVDCIFWAKKSDGSFDSSLISHYGVVLARYEKSWL